MSIAPPSSPRCAAAVTPLSRALPGPGHVILPGGRRTGSRNQGVKCLWERVRVGTMLRGAGGMRDVRVAEGAAHPRHPSCVFQLVLLGDSPCVEGEAEAENRSPLVSSCLTLTIPVNFLCGGIARSQYNVEWGHGHVQVNTHPAWLGLEPSGPSLASHPGMPVAFVAVSTGIGARQVQWSLPGCPVSL